VFVHHDSNAWISVCLKFESLKNEFEKNLKRKKRKPPPSPSSFSPTGPLLLSARDSLGPAAFFLSSPCVRSQPTAAQPPLPPAQHRAPPIFFLRLRPTGGARPSGLSPTSSRGSAAPPSRRRPLPAASPAPLTFKHRNQAAMKPSLHFPLFNRRLPSLIFPPLIPHQGRGH
jgi:hypothetical protein